MGYSAATLNTYRRPRPQLSIDGRSTPRKLKQRSSNFKLLIGSLLIASPFAPEKFLKQFTALLREHAAVDIAAMI